MISCGALAAYVECQDENGVWSALPEYRVTTPDTKTASCFIESKAGSPFRVNYYELHKMAQYDTIVRVFVDGKEMSAYIHGRAHPCGPNSCKTIEGVRSDARSLLPFKFAKLTLTDDDDIATKDEQVVKHVGSIMVKLFRAIQGPAGTNVYNGTAAIQSHVLHERAKKATLDHSTAFGQAKTVAVGYLHWFKYRSGDLLESDGIKPPVPGARDVSGEPAAEASGPNAKRKATSASRTPVDIDDSDDDRNASKKVKREKKKPVTAGRVIDIDDDDEETEIQKLRRENEQLRQKVKVEGKASSSKKGEVIDID